MCRGGRCSRSKWQMGATADTNTADPAPLCPQQRLLCVLLSRVQTTKIAISITRSVIICVCPIQAIQAIVSNHNSPVVVELIIILSLSHCAGQNSGEMFNLLYVLGNIPLTKAIINGIYFPLVFGMRSVMDPFKP
eukprot:scpid99445/ scgid14611/ 